MMLIEVLVFLFRFFPKNQEMVYYLISNHHFKPKIQLSGTIKEKALH